MKFITMVLLFTVTIAAVNAQKLSQENTAQRDSLKSPISVTLTPEQFEKHCLATATLDANDKAFYEPVSNGGIKRYAGSGHNSYTVIQRISEGLFIARTSGEGFRANLVAVRSYNDNLMDTPTIWLPRNVRNPETYLYKTVSGEAKNLSLYEHEPPITEAQIMERFKAGYPCVLPVKITKIEPCANCKGGFVTLKAGGGTRMALCPKCGGKRSITMNIELMHSVTCSKPPQKKAREIFQ